MRGKPVFHSFWFVNEHLNCCMHTSLSLCSYPNKDLLRQVLVESFKSLHICSEVSHKLCFLCFQRCEKGVDSERLSSILHGRQQGSSKVFNLTMNLNPSWCFSHTYLQPVLCCCHSVMHMNIVILSDRLTT